jgi:hypothetical protein
MHVRPTRNVARREDARHARLEVLVHENAAFNPNPRPFRECDPGPYPDARYNEIRVDAAASSEEDVVSFDPRRRLSQMELDPMLLMKRLDEASEVRPEDLLHREGVGSDRVHLDIASPERGGYLQTDEAGA